MRPGDGDCRHCSFAVSWQRGEPLPQSTHHTPSQGSSSSPTRYNHGTVQGIPVELARAAHDACQEAALRAVHLAFCAETKSVHVVARDADDLVGRVDESREQPLHPPSHALAKGGRGGDARKRTRLGLGRGFASGLPLGAPGGRAARGHTPAGRRGTAQRPYSVLE